MSEQIWGIGGAIAGIAATSGFNWWTERAKHNREEASSVRKDNRKRCESLIHKMESHVAEVRAFYDEHDAFPVEVGHDPYDSEGREMLVELQMSCPPKVYSGAVSLVEAFEAWEGRNGSKEDYDASRTTMIDLMRRYL